MALSTGKCVGAVCLAILGVVGLILLIFGCLLPGLANSAYKSGVSSLLVVDDGIQLEQYNQWVANGTLDESASKYDYYIPSLTNLADVMTKGAAPIFEDKGPYALNGYSKKYDIKFGDDLLSMRTMGGYSYNASDSCTNQSRVTTNCKGLDEKITTINPAYLGLMGNFESLDGEGILVPFLGAAFLGGPPATSQNLFIGAQGKPAFMERESLTKSTILQFIANAFLPSVFAQDFFTATLPAVAGGPFAATSADFATFAMGAVPGNAFFSGGAPISGPQGSYLSGITMAATAASVAAAAAGGDAAAQAKAAADTQAAFAAMNADNIVADIWDSTKAYSFVANQKAGEQLTAAQVGLPAGTPDYLIQVKKDSAVMGNFLKMAATGFKDTTAVPALLASIKNTRGLTRWMFVFLSTLPTFQPVLQNTATFNLGQDITTEMAATLGTADPAVLGVKGPLYVQAIGAWVGGAFGFSCADTTSTVVAALTTAYKAPCVVGQGADAYGDTRCGLDDAKAAELAKFDAKRGVGGATTCADLNGLGVALAKKVCPATPPTPAACTTTPNPAGGTVNTCNTYFPGTMAEETFNCNPTKLSDAIAIHFSTGSVPKALGLSPNAVESLIAVGASLGVGIPYNPEIYQTTTPASPATPGSLGGKSFSIASSNLIMDTILGKNDLTLPFIDCDDKATRDTHKCCAANECGQLLAAFRLKMPDAAITGITAAAKAAVTAVNGLKNGQIVTISGVQGMVEINGKACEVESQSITGFTCSNIDSTAFTAYTAGGMAASAASPIFNTVAAQLGAGIPAKITAAVAGLSAPALAGVADAVYGLLNSPNLVEAAGGATKAACATYTPPANPTCASPTWKPATATAADVIASLTALVAGGAAMGFVNGATATGPVAYPTVQTAAVTGIHETLKPQFALMRGGALTFKQTLAPVVYASGQQGSGPDGACKPKQTNEDNAECYAPAGNDGQLASNKATSYNDVNQMGNAQANNFLVNKMYLACIQSTEYPGPGLTAASLGLADSALTAALKLTKVGAAASMTAIISAVDPTFTADFSDIPVNVGCDFMTTPLFGSAVSYKEMQSFATYLTDGIVGNYYKNVDAGYSVSTGAFVNLGEKNTGVFVTRTAAELLIDGYAEPIYGLVAPAFGLDPKAPSIVTKDTPGALTEAEITADRKKEEDPCGKTDGSDASAAFHFKMTSSNKYPTRAIVTSGASWPGAAAYCGAPKAVGGAGGYKVTKPPNQGKVMHDTGKGDLDKRNLLIALDGTSKMEGKCSHGIAPLYSNKCWDPKAQFFEPAAGGSNLGFPNPQTIQDGWRYGNPSTKPSFDLIKEEWPPASGAETKIELPTYTNAYISQVRRALKLEYKENVKVPDTELTLRRFGIDLAKEGVYWKGKKDVAINAEGYSCLIDISEINSPTTAFLGPPHLAQCTKADYAKSTSYTTAAFDTTTFNPGSLETTVDIEPHTGATMCANERLGAYLGIDSSTMKIFNGWTCSATPGLNTWPGTELSCPVAKDYIVPYYWLRRHACIKPKDAKTVLAGFAAAKSAMFTVNLILIIVGVILALVGIIGATVLCMGKGTNANVAP
jgi:hypothetical protein